MSPKNALGTVVVDKKDLTPELMLLWLEPPRGFSFKPGQYCTIGLGETERPYSIVSAPHERNLELFIELAPREFQTPKSLTPKLWELQRGDTLMMRSKAKGIFFLEEEYQTHVMVATVAGIAPFMSMLRAYRNGYYKKPNYHPRFYVFHGASHCDEFGYRNELISFQNDGLIIHVPAVSRPGEKRNGEWQGARGRVNLILEEYFAGLGILPEATMVYLCGNQGMIDDLGNTKPTSKKPLGKLVVKGFQVKEEVFF